MKNFLAIVDVTSGNRIAKFQDFDVLTEAENHVEAVLDRFPKAFAVANPDGGSMDWLIDTDAKTAVFDKLPPDPPRDPRFEKQAKAIEAATTVAEVKSAVAALARAL